ncbi:alkaline phosphatase [Exiguobacterium sp. ERU656]|uniref:alkaline phosphatase n=1 Tax=Exiguobacterium sp. ERU656 TaxID=2751217 RepID=UPI001BEB0B06|nr:alkaline phosphatase [Exiguobacterium sp. ERU656]
MRKKYNKIFAVTFSSIIVSSLILSNDPEVSGKSSDNDKKKNVVFMVADGYSAAYATNYRIFNGKDSVLDPYLTGMVKTYSASSKITDSAAAATAMSTGVKTKNGYIGVSPDNSDLITMIEAINTHSKKSTGLVSTTRLTDATPASFAAHSIGRNADQSIANQLINQKVDVLLGGGKSYFTDETLAQASNENYQLVTDRSQLSSKVISNDDRLLGLFSDSDMAPEIDRESTNEPSLKEMSEKAINHLNKNKNGFFLMIEGGQIDSGGHVHDVPWIMNDIRAFEDTVQSVIDFAKKDKNTLVIVVGDHDTGGMSVGGYDKFGSNIESLRSVTASGSFMVNQFDSSKSNVREVLKNYANIDLTDSEYSRIFNSSNPSKEINSILSERSLVGWINYGHTGQDVPLYSYGKNANQFRGIQDNIELPEKISKVLEIPFPFN